MSIDRGCSRAHAGGRSWTLLNRFRLRICPTLEPAVVQRQISTNGGAERTRRDGLSR